MDSQSGSVLFRRPADLKVVHKTVIDTLHKEGKPQKVIAREGGCTQCYTYQHSWRLEWKEELGKKKVHKQKGNLRTVKQNPFKKLWSVLRSGPRQVPLQADES